MKTIEQNVLVKLRHSILDWGTGIVLETWVKNQGSTRYKQDMATCYWTWTPVSDGRSQILDHPIDALKRIET